ncbi:helix-turn-helix transcriptional regulator [Natronomonas sp. EA1]|uniref:helix-turn-helix transcriptional regulator n=1 Tax=Natronomonas sp. EA1 TaxID=3421655 RepID=UPI003EBF2BC0
MTRPSVTEFVPILLQRVNLFKYLLETPADQSELNRELDESRSTIYRGLKRLEENGLIEKQDSVYQPTNYGILVFKEYQRFADTTNSLLDYKEIFDTKQPIGSLLHPSLLRDATILSMNDHMPDELYETLHESVAEASFVYGIAPTIFSNQVEPHLEKTTADELTAEFILPSSGVEYFQSKFSDELETLLDTGNFSIQVCQYTPPFGLVAVVEPIEKTVLVIHDEIGTVRGIIVSQNPEAIVWGRDTYQNFREECVSYDKFLDQ